MRNQIYISPKRTFSRTPSPPMGATLYAFRPAFYPGVRKNGSRKKKPSSGNFSRSNILKLEKNQMILREFKTSFSGGRRGAPRKIFSRTRRGSGGGSQAPLTPHSWGDSERKKTNRFWRLFLFCFGKTGDNDFWEKKEVSFGRENYLRMTSPLPPLGWV